MGVANIVLKYSRRSHEIWACQNTSNNSETKCRRDVLHEGRKREGRGTILYSVPFAKHEGRHTHNQNDPHWCPQRTGRACLRPLIAFARTCALKHAGINRDAQNSKYISPHANQNSLFGGVVTCSHTATTATIMQLIICRCTDVITLTTVSKTCQYHNGEAITEVQ